MEIAALDKIQKTFVEIKAVLETDAKKPTPKTAKFLRDWAVNWGFSTEMILYALKENGRSLPEANKLLKKYHAMNIYDIQSAELKKKKTITSKVEKSYDVNNVGRNSILERMKNKEKESANV